MRQPPDFDPGSTGSSLRFSALRWADFRSFSSDRPCHSSRGSMDSCSIPLVLLAGDSTLQLASALPGISAIPGIDLVNLPAKVFATNFFVAALFLGIASLAFIQPRFWCRNLCPGRGRDGHSRTITRLQTPCGRVVHPLWTVCARVPHRGNFGNPGKNGLWRVHRVQPLRPRSAPCPPFLSLSAPLPDRNSRCPCPTSPGGALFFSLAGGLLTAGLLRTSIGYPLAFGREGTFTGPELMRPPGAVPEAEFRMKCLRCGGMHEGLPHQYLAAGLAAKRAGGTIYTGHDPATRGMRVELQYLRPGVSHRSHPRFAYGRKEPRQGWAPHG